MTAGGVRYRTIVADPPWPYRAADGGMLRASAAHRPNSFRSAKNGPGMAGRYQTMPIDELCALAIPRDDDAHLYLWTTNAFMYEAHDLARAWGFSPKTILTWVKTHQDDPGRVSMKTGYYFRGATEHVLFCVRGSLPLSTTDALPTAFLWPRQPHSVKPEAFYDLVEQASPGPYLELFARRQRLGWHTWGNEALNHVSLTPDVGGAESA